MHCRLAVRPLRLLSLLVAASASVGKARVAVPQALPDGPAGAIFGGPRMAGRRIGLCSLTPLEGQAPINERAGPCVFRGALAGRLTGFRRRLRQLLPQMLDQGVVGALQERAQTLPGWAPMPSCF